MMDDLSPEVRRWIREWMDAPMQRELQREIQRQQDQVRAWIAQTFVPSPAEIARMSGALSPELIAQMTGALTAEQLAKMAGSPTATDIAKLIAGSSNTGHTQTEVQAPYEQIEEEFADSFARVMRPLSDHQRARLFLRLQAMFFASIHPDQQAESERPEN